MFPIAFLVDDGCPLIHVYRHHRTDVSHAPPLTGDSRALVEFIPNAFLDDFCDVCERWGVAGKFSIVPAPAARGDVASGIEGFPPAETRAWVETALRRLGPHFDFTPECITHNLAVDLPAGGSLPMSESEWSQTQTRETLTPYLARALRILAAAGVDANGFTSPWVFGIQVEGEYAAAMAAAQRAVYGRDTTWYFLHTIGDAVDGRPSVTLQDARGRVVSVPATVPDVWWETIDHPSADPEAMARRAYARVVAVAEGGGVPAVLTHWQSLFSNGLARGLRSFDRFAALIAADGRFTWQRCSDLAESVPE